MNLMVSVGLHPGPIASKLKMLTTVSFGNNFIFLKISFSLENNFSLKIVSKEITSLISLILSNANVEHSMQ